MSTTSERAFPGTVAQVSDARRWTVARLAGTDVPDGAAADAVLCVSELATNAIRHSLSGTGGGRFRVKIVLTPGAWLLVEVHDQGPRPEPRHAEPEDEGGRGLLIVSELAADYGQEPGVAWFRLPLPAAVPAPALSPEEAGALW